MTRLESVAVLLANEIEQYIAQGTNRSISNLVLTLSEFRKAQNAADLVLGTDLDDMFKQYQHSNIDAHNVISIAKKRIKIIK